MLCYVYTEFLVAGSEKACDEICQLSILFAHMGALLKPLWFVFPGAKFSENLEGSIHFRTPPPTLAGQSSPVYPIHFSAIIAGLISARQNNLSKGRELFLYFCLL